MMTSWWWPGLGSNTTVTAVTTGTPLSHGLWSESGRQSLSPAYGGPEAWPRPGCRPGPRARASDTSIASAVLRLPILLVTVIVSGAMGPRQGRGPQGGAGSGRQSSNNDCQKHLVRKQKNGLIRR